MVDQAKITAVLHFLQQSFPRGRVNTVIQIDATGEYSYLYLVLEPWSRCIAEAGHG